MLAKPVRHVVGWGPGPIRRAAASLIAAALAQVVMAVPGCGAHTGLDVPASTSCASFYYDRDLQASPPPSHIILCPATCDLLNGAKDRSIEVLVSCPG